MPTTFSRTGEKSSEEAIEDVNWGQSQSIDVIWGLSQIGFGIVNLTDITVSHSNLERLPCFFHAFSPLIPVMTIQLDAVSLTTLELGEAYITEAAITVEDGEQSMQTSWRFATRTETLEGTSYCFDLRTNTSC